MKKRSLLIIGSAAIVIIGAVLGYQYYTQKVYVDNARYTAELMLETSKLTETVLTKYSTVWKNAIYKEGPYFVSSSPYYQQDFNGALQTAFSESKTSLDLIAQSSIKADSIMKLMQDPPTKYVELNSKIISLYGTYVEYSALAISPQGSLMSFNNKASDLASELITNYKQVSILLP